MQNRNVFGGFQAKRFPWFTFSGNDRPSRISPTLLVSGDMPNSSSQKKGIVDLDFKITPSSVVRFQDAMHWGNDLPGGISQKRLVSQNILHSKHPNKRKPSQTNTKVLVEIRDIGNATRQVHADRGATWTGGSWGDGHKPAGRLHSSSILINTQVIHRLSRTARGSKCRYPCGIFKIVSPRDPVAQDGDVLDRLRKSYGNNTQNPFSQWIGGSQNVRPRTEVWRLQGICSPYSAHCFGGTLSLQSLIPT